MDLDDVRLLALALPGAHEQPHFELTSFRVGTKIFATAPVTGQEVRIFVDEDEAMALDAEGLPGVALLRWGRRVSGVSIALDGADPERVGELLTESWRRRAPKRDVAVHDAAHPFPDPDGDR